MVSHDVPFSTPKAFDVVSNRFDAFCAELSLTVLSSAVVRHWCWEWSASRGGDLNRYVILLAWENPGRSRQYQSELWAEADRDKLFTRRRVARLHFSDGNVRDATFVAKLDAALASTWRDAQEFTKDDLTRGDTHDADSESEKAVPAELRRDVEQAREPTIPRALVIDDDPVTRAAVRRILEEGPRPIEVDEAKDGLEALRSTESHVPDLVVLGLTMPNMDGFAVLERLRGNPDLASVPIMLLTGEAVSPSEAKLLGIVADDYVSKPVELSKLSERLEQMLRRPHSALTRRKHRS